MSAIRFARRLPMIGATALIAATSVRAQVPTQASCQMATASDVDPQLTELLKRREQEFADVIIRRDTTGLEHLLAPDFALRIADVPQPSMPRAMWLSNTLNELKGDSAVVSHCAARRLATDLGVMSLVFTQRGSMGGRDVSGDFYLVDLWKQNGGTWQIIARYSSPIGRAPVRGNRQVPPPADVDSQLTKSLAQLEYRLGDLALHGFADTHGMDDIVASEFTLRTADAPDRSLSRSQWGQPGVGYKIDSLKEQHHAARRLANDLAVVAFVLTQKATRAGEDRSGDFYVIDIWKQRNARWQLIARYSSPQGKSFDRPVPR